MLKRIAWLEPFWVLLWGALLLLPARFAPAAVEPILAQGKPWFILALGFGWLVRWIAYGRFSRPTPIDLPVLLLLLWLPVNFWASADKALSWEAIGYLVFGISLYAALVNWPPLARHPQWIAWALLLFGVGLLVAAPLLSQVFGDATMGPLKMRVINARHFKRIVPFAVAADIPMQRHHQIEESLEEQHAVGCHGVHLDAVGVDAVGRPAGDVVVAPEVGWDQGPP